MLSAPNFRPAHEGPAALPPFGPALAVPAPKATERVVVVDPCMIRPRVGSGPALATPGSSGFSRRKVRPARERKRTNRQPFGLLQEHLVAEGLRAEGFRVETSHALDGFAKLDLVVDDPSRPSSPVVGVQITLKFSREKRDRTFAAVRRQQVVDRFLYLRLLSPVNRAGVAVVGRLLKTIANDLDPRGLVYAELGAGKLSAIERYAQAS